MSLSENSVGVITRALPKAKIKQRPGGGGMTFDYITPATAIDLLNEAFAYGWSSSIVDHFREDDVVIVAIKLSVRDEHTGCQVTKEQYGSCQITRGLGVGEAYKGAASDALKKAATHFGIGLELYQDDGPVSNFVAPAASSARPSADKQSPVSPLKTSVPSSTTTGRLPAQKTTTTAPPRTVSAPNADAFAQFDSPSTATAEVKKPQPISPAPTAETRPNPFGKKSVGASEGPNATQINALTNLATRKNFDQAQLIALASVVDAEGNSKTEFDSLGYDEAIQVIRAAQQ